MTPLTPPIQALLDKALAEFDHYSWWRTHEALIAFAHDIAALGAPLEAVFTAAESLSTAMVKAEELGVDFDPIDDQWVRLTAAIQGVYAARKKMTDEQIKHLVNRFLGWRLPEYFRPDNGISFKQVIYQGMSEENQAAQWPTGTNLFDASQADAMVRYMLDGMPNGAPAVEPSDAGAIGEALGLFASVIKSGEAWSPDCERAQAQARAALVRLLSASQ